MKVLLFMALLVLAACTQPTMERKIESLEWRVMMLEGKQRKDSIRQAVDKKIYGNMFEFNAGDVK
jgi:hypothetical protein